MTGSARLSAERLGVAIVGCGLIGQRRAKALASARLTACADVKRDRAEALARTASGATASRDRPRGLGGSYGVERLAFYKMLPEMGPPETTIWEYPRGDRSWALEFEEFLEDIRLDRTPSPGLGDARAALAVVEEVHRQSGYPKVQALR